VAVAIARQAQWNSRQIPREIEVFESQTGFPVIFLSDVMRRVGQHGVSIQS
jgi:hypothetical protein